VRHILLTPQRTLLCLTCVALAAAGLISSLFVGRWQQWDQLYQQVAKLSQQALLVQQHRAVNVQLQEKFAQSDERYLDRQIESLSLLDQRIGQLRQFVEAHPCALNDELHQQLRRWTGGQNRLLFVDGTMQRQASCQEICKALAHPVQLDSNDLARLLERIEGPYPEGSHPPQLLITDLSLEKMGQGGQNEVFQMDLKLLKRDFN
jgi:hypothetical protein